MIRIKVLSVRQAINNLESFFMMVGFTIFSLLFFVLTVYVLEREFKESVLSNTNTEKSEVLSNRMVANRILQNKKAIFHLGNIEENALFAEKEKNVIDNSMDSNWKADEIKNVYRVPSDSSAISENNNNITNMNEETLATLKTTSYQLPKNYSVKLQTNGNIVVGKAKIINYTKRHINLEELTKPSTFQINTDSSFLIFHTHTSESYTVPETNEIVNYRTTNEKYNMITVGNALCEALKGFGFNVLHNTTLHDYPNYNGSYAASLKTVQQIFKEHHYDFVIDIHRDALSSNYHFRPTVEIDGEKAAKLMFVIGTNTSGLEHERWMENLKLALMIQNRAEEMYPGLFRDLTLSSSRYNQHVSDGAFILEVGATGNTLDEARNAMKYLANVIATLKE